MLRSFLSPPAFLLKRILLDPREAACNILHIIKKMDNDPDCLYFVGTTPAMKRLSRFIPKNIENGSEKDIMDEVENIYCDTLKSLPPSTLTSITKSFDTSILGLKRTMKLHSNSVENVDMKLDALKRIRNEFLLAMR